MFLDLLHLFFLSLFKTMYLTYFINQIILEQEFYHMVYIEFLYRMKPLIILYMFILVLRGVISMRNILICYGIEV